MMGKNSGQHRRAQSNGANINEAASELLHAGKRKANELWEEGMHTLNDAQDSIKSYSHEMVHKVQEKPLKSLLIAAGIGFLLSTLLRR